MELCISPSTGASNETLEQEVACEQHIKFVQHCAGSQLRIATVFPFSIPHIVEAKRVLQDAGVNGYAFGGAGHIPVHKFFRNNEVEIVWGSKTCMQHFKFDRPLDESTRRMIEEEFRTQLQQFLDSMKQSLGH